MIESESGRGEVVKALIEHEGELLQTDAGQAFDGFYQLLCDQNRITEFREQIRSILARPASQYLKSDELRYLSHLVRELGKESERVFQVRRRTEESLRAFVESGVQQERRAVERLLRQLERLAVNFKDQELSRWLWTSPRAVCACVLRPVFTYDYLKNAWIPGRWPQIPIVTSPVSACWITSTRSRCWK